MKIGKGVGIGIFVILVVVLILLGVLREIRTPIETHELGGIVQYTMVDSLNPDARTLTADVSLKWADADVDTFFFMLHSGLEIGNIQADKGVQGELLMLAMGDSIPSYIHRLVPDPDPEARYGHLSLYALPVSGRMDTTTIHITYSGVIYDSVGVPEFSRWQIADETTGLIGDRGAFLTPWTGFYPVQPGVSPLATFHTQIHYPDGWQALVEGNQIVHEKNRSVFYSDHPIDGCYLVAGPYDYNTQQAGDVEVAMYSYPDSKELVPRYLSASARYLKMYDKLLGPYAFKRFSVVENWFPTGYGMPSYTLLGSQVLRLPFIIYTSLGHEICHNWWGNGVLVDYDTGNWCEGLTVYCADYHYKLQQSEEAAKQYRMDVLRDYSDYIVRGDENDFPVRDFTSRTTAGTRTIGYGKVMMIFHMLERRIGSDIFWKSLKQIYADKQFTRASWSDFFETFEENSGKRLDWFEKQWIDRPGAPELSVNHILARQRADTKTMLEFDLYQSQEEEPFHMNVPVKITLSDGSVVEEVLRDVRGRMYHARVEVDGDPVHLDVDPDFHVFRVLDPLEAPATLSGFLAGEKPVVVLPPAPADVVESYRKFATDFFSRETPEIVESGQYNPELYTGRHVMFLGTKRHVNEAMDVMQKDGTTLDPKGLAVVAAFRSEEDPNVVNLEVWASSPEALMPLASKLPHYGKYSYLAFSSGTNVGKGQWIVSKSPLKIDLP